MSGDPRVPTISRVLDDGTLIELVYDPVEVLTSFAVASCDGTVSQVPFFDAASGERLAPYSARNNLIATECVLLPSDVGDFGDKREVVEAVQAFLHRYVDLSPLFEQLAAHYVLLTWVYDAFSDLPYLRFRGDYGTGKTRALIAVGSLCYKPFFASGASTVSPIFHIQDAFQGTLVLDEADFRFSDQTAELTKVLNNGSTRGLPVLRTMTNKNRELNPTAFRVFGPKIVAMREDFSDKALESRFITEDTGSRPLRRDIPVHLPASFRDEARLIRNRLLAWRFATRRTAAVDPERLPRELSPRLKQSALSVLSLIDDEQLREKVCDMLANLDRGFAEERALTWEAVMVGSIVAAFAAAKTPHVALGDIAERFNARLSEDLDRPLSNKWVGNFVRARLRLATVKTGGVYVVPPTERARVFALAERFNVPQIA